MATLNISVQVNLSFKQIVEAVKQLTPSEKYQLNEIIWADDIEIPKAHQELVLDRLQKGEKDPSRLSDWDEFAKNW